MAKMVGKVKRFSDEKGFGFILGEDGKDYFVHWKELNMPGRKTVTANTKVEFDPVETEKGWRAEHVDIIKEDKAPENK